MTTDDVGSFPENSFLVIAKEQEDGWAALTQFDQQFEEWLYESPKSLIAREAIPLLLPSNQPGDGTLMEGIPITLRFPWLDGQMWKLGSYGIHGGNGNALDFIPAPSIPVEERQIVAAAGGVVYRKCSRTDTQQEYIVIRHPDNSGAYATEYLHLDRTTVSLEVSDLVNTGDVIGTILDFSGVMPPEEPCSSENKGPHVHFGVGKIENNNFVRTSISGTTIYGWTVNVNGCLTKGTSTRCAGEYFSSTDGEVGGQVVYLSGPPASGADVKFTKGPIIDKAIADGDGFYLLSSVPAGIVTLTAVTEVASGSITIFVNANQSQIAPDIVLENSCPALLAGLVNRIHSGLCDPIDNDAASFVSHISIPDGTVVSPGQSLVKTWRMKNTGTTAWGSGYELVFVNGEQMGAPATINIPATSPGQTVDLSINITAPTNPGNHAGYWRLRNPQGTYFGDLIWVKINVQDQSDNITLTTDPASPAAADQVQIYARVDDFPNLRALRILVDGEPLCELGAPEITDCTWHTNGYATGQHAIVAQADDWSGPPWDDPATKTIVFELTGGGSTNHAPHRPDPVSPYNWYVYYSGNSAQLCAQHNGDPDGDPVTGYYFDIYDSPETWNSGWASDSCITTGSLGPYTYQWRVKVRDNQGAESEWSDSWHFTLVSPDLTIDELYFEPQDGNSEQVKIRACTSGQGGVGITMRVSVNDASDGSDDGEWHIIKELGVPCFNDIDAPVWHTLGYGDGPHRVKVEAHGVDTSWDGAAVREEVYTLPHRRPASTHLVAPVPFTEDITEVIYLNSRTIEFIWDPTIRADSFTLHVSDSPNPKGDPTPIFRQSFAPTVLSHTVTFTADYPLLYWQVEAANDAGSNASGDQKFGIDRVAPSCTVEPLPEVSSEVLFQVSWGGSDNLAGVRTFDIQYLDSGRESWSDWLVNVPSAQTYKLFTGQPGHSYAFRCLATDHASNTGDYPASADTSTLIDLSANPTTPWWNEDYSGKRNLTILNNMPDKTLPAGYPVHLHFDSGTTPTAAEIYGASQSSPPCNDLRIVYNNTTELDRVMQNCSSSMIDIWFRSQVSIPGGTVDSNSNQLYFGNPVAGTPPGNPNQVWYPTADSNTTNLYFFQEGSGATAFDSSGNGRNCSIDPSVLWSSGKFGHGLRFNRANGGDSRSLNCGVVPPLTTFTIEFWYKPDPDDSGWIAGASSGGGNGGGGINWIIQLFEGKIRLDVWPCPTCGSSEVRSNVNLTEPPYVGVWNHVAVTFNGDNQVRFYVNGTLDSTKTLPQSGINTFSPPLEIGSVEGIRQIKANLGVFRISNIVRTSFPYGVYGNITSEPATAAGTVVGPPETGTADLTLLDLAVFPSPTGGLLAQAMVQNQGDFSTQNGFFTDLYIDHLPSGAGDYDGSVQFWVNEPVAAGETITLTTVLTEASAFIGTMPLALAAGGEVSGTFYAQVDSTGVVSETDNLNNIYTAGTPFCLANADAYEPDDTFNVASPILAGDVQTHNFDTLGDTDWISFSAQAGTSYTLKTSDLGDRADTYLYIYDQDGITELAANDDHGGTLASQIVWTAPASGTYYAAVRHWNPNIGGCSTQYEVQINTNAVYLPIMLGFTATAAPATLINSNLLPVGFGWVAQPVLLPVSRVVGQSKRR